MEILAMMKLGVNIFFSVINASAQVMGAFIDNTLNEINPNFFNLKKRINQNRF